MPDGTIPIAAGQNLDANEVTRPSGTIVEVERIALRSENDPRGTLTPAVSVEGLLPILKAILREIRSVREILASEQIEALDALDESLDALLEDDDDDGEQDQDDSEVT